MKLTDGWYDPKLRQGLSTAMIPRPDSAPARARAPTPAPKHEEFARAPAPKREEFARAPARAPAPTRRTCSSSIQRHWIYKMDRCEFASDRFEDFIELL